jgi:hypothetical protein
MGAWSTQLEARVRRNVAVVALINKLAGAIRRAEDRRPQQDASRASDDHAAGTPSRYSHKREGGTQDPYSPSEHVADGRRAFLGSL